MKETSMIIFTYVLGIAIFAGLIGIVTQAFKD
ncbi:potassium transporter KtrB [Rhodobacteraceae bacterium ASV31]|nr:potassium transporter KtrB [Anianabacter salinae]MBV0912498.1 potassium transporter KtrB [Anianabacter salinae]